MPGERVTMPDTSQLDLMQRFLPAPYRFCIGGAEGTVHIESNDLELALSVRSLCLNPGHPGVSMVDEWRIMRDYKAPRIEGTLTLLADETLRTLFAGDDSVLMLDVPQRKVFGFVGSMSGNDLVANLLPLLFAA
jgi:hypothetical protein